MSSNIENIYFECNPTSGEGTDVIEIKPKTIKFDKTSSRRTTDFSYWLLGFVIFAVIGYITAMLFNSSKGDGGMGGGGSGSAKIKGGFKFK
tara:strand:- start:662 stop:934 length:273 start_codon:yes stop_codon:yes gene_type:complete